MKNNLLTKTLFALAVLFSTMAQAVQLNGTYTIDANGTASATVFKNFVSAINYLTGTTARTDGGPANTAPFGVSGPVVFNVAAGTYTVTTAISIPAISGASPINTITFDGGTGNAATRVITGNLATSSVLRFNLCKYVTVQNLTIINSYTSNCGVVVFYNNTTTGSSATSSPGGSCNTLRNCVLTLSGLAGSTATSSCISVSNNVNGYSFSTQYSDSNLIEGNTTNNGYYAIALYGASSASYNRGVIVRKNIVNNASYYGIYWYYHYNPTIVDGNDITVNNVSSGSGMYLYSNTNTNATQGTRVINNKVRAPYGGIWYYYQSGMSTAPGLVANNLIICGTYSTNYGLYNYNNTGYYNNVVHNTIVTFSSSSGYGMYHYGDASNINIKDNIFCNFGSASVYPAYFSTNPSGNVINHNVYWNNSGTNLLYRGAVYTPANYLGATAGGDSSFNTKPAFVNINYGGGTADAHLTDGCGSKGFFLAGISPTTDVDGDVRPTIQPAVGADEAGGNMNDLLLSAVLAPTIPITLGLQNVVVTVRNVGTNVINNFDINYIQNGGTMVSQTWTGTLPPCTDVQVTMTGPNQINLVSSNNVKVFTSSPNSSLDPRRSNDTISMQFFAPLNGTYTIGGTNPDFLNFAQATNALSSGVMGPVVFDVRPGTYTGQVKIPAAAGASPINTISFIGQNKATTIISANIASQAGLILNQCKYVTIENLTINNTNGSGAGIGIVGNGADNAGGSNTVKNCIINMLSSTGTQYPLMVTSTATGYGAASNMVDSLTIDSNTWNNGYYGLYVYGYTTTGVGIYNRGIKIRGNTLNNMYYMGMYLYYISGGLEVRNNKINMTTTLGQTNQYGIYAYCYNYIATQYKGITSIFDGNIVDANYYAMYLYYPYGTYNNPLRITNNIIKPSFSRYSGGGYYGIYLYMYSSVIVSDPTPSALLYHNTIYHNGNSSAYGFYFAGDGGTYQDKLDIKNNIFACGQTSGGAVYLGSNPNAGSTTPIDYNIYYRQGGGNVLYRNGIWYNQSNVVSFAGGGSNSYYLDPPPFANFATGDLHISNACTKGMNTTTWVPYDVDGEMRAGQPNIGADEYPGLSRDVSVDAIVSPVFPISAGAQNLTLRIRNNGSDVINSVNISYSLNNGPAVTMPWVGTLNPCSSVEVLFTGINQINIPNANNTFVAWTSNPNGGVDQMMSNDTLKSAALAPPLNGAYTVAASGGDFVNLTAAVNALNLRGMGSAVTINVMPGTYVEPNAVQFSGIIGLTDTSRLVIQSTSGINSNTIIQSAASPVIGITQLSNIDIIGIQIRQTVGGGNVMNLGGIIKNCNFYNCDFNGPLTTATSYVVYQNGSALTNVTFKKNIFRGCYYGLYLQSTSTFAGQNADVVIDSNTFTQISYYDWYLLYHRNMKVRYNTININNGANTSYAYLYGPMYPDSALEVAYNTVNNTSTGYYYWYYNGYYGNGGYLPSSRIKIHHNTVNYQQTSGYGYWYYWGYYGNREDIYNNRINNLSASNYTYVYYPGYYGNGVNFYNNVLPMNSAYFAYTGYASGQGAKYYNNSLHSTTSYTIYYHYGGTSSGEGVEYKNNSITNSASGNPLYTGSALTAAADKFDYNNLYTTGTVLVTGSNTYNNLSDMKAAGYCKYCVSADAGYTNINTNLTPNPTNANSWTLNGQGVQLAKVDMDYNDQPRSITMATGAQDLGAYEFTPTATPPACTLAPVAPPATGGAQVVTYGRDTVARIIWAGGTVPTSVTARLYSGTNPLNVVYANGSYANAYWDISVSPAGSYNYGIELYHKGIWQGTNPSANTMIGSQYVGAWQFLFGSSNDVTSNKLVLNNLTSFGQYTGTDLNAPFTPSLVVLSDKNKQNIANQPLNVYPNPFNSDLNVRVDLSTAGNVTMTLVDIMGKTIMTKVETMAAGVNNTVLNNVADLKAGIYFLNVEMNGQNHVQKLIKQ